MSRNFRLRPISEDEDSRGEESKLIDRRDFLRYSFNTAAGGITSVSYTHLTLPTNREV